MRGEGCLEVYGKSRRLAGGRPDVRPVHEIARKDIVGVRCATGSERIGGRQWLRLDLRTRDSLLLTGAPGCEEFPELIEAIAAILAP